jgi:hypothetical protein
MDRTGRTQLTLIVPERSDPERDAVAACWDGPVLRLARFWEPPALDPSTTRVYGGDAFCQVVAQQLELKLISPPDDLLATLPFELVGRRIVVDTLSGCSLPAFVKPLTPKLFTAGVYTDLREETRGLEPDTPVLVSEIVEFLTESRGFVLHGEVVSCSDPDARTFLQEVASWPALPVTCVLDAGRLPDGRWVLVEANATWGAGLNGCDPAAVVECLAAASGVGPPASGTSQP